MSIAPQKQREILFLLLYSSDFGSEDEVIEMLMFQLSVTKKTVRESMLMRANISEKMEAIDLVIEEHSKSYAFDRIPMIERTILRLAVYELLCVDTVPPKVALSEAIRLARKFATPEAATFVNAVLDAIYTQRMDADASDISSQPVSVG